MQTFFRDEDYRNYKSMLACWSSTHGVEVWAYCLMPNHVHLVLVPAKKDSLHKAVSETHRRYTQQVNQREGWQGHLWQDRFKSYVMDQPYLLAAVRYIEMNPVHAGLVKRPGDYPWSSASAHLGARDDGLVRVNPTLDMVEDWTSYLTHEDNAKQIEQLRKSEKTGRPLGTDSFISKLEALLGISVKKKKTGPKGPRKN